MDRPEDMVEANAHQSGALPLSMLKGIVGGATNQTNRSLSEQDAAAGVDLDKITKDFAESLHEGGGLPLTAGADSYTKTKHTLTAPAFGVDNKFETVKNSSALDRQDKAMREDIAKNVTTTSKALDEATLKSAKAAETLKTTTLAHDKATDRVAEKAEDVKIVKEHGNSKFLVDNHTKAHEAAKDHQATTAKNVEAAKSDVAKSEKDLAGAKSAADAAKAKQAELDASDKKAKEDKDAGKSKGAAGKVADFASKHMDKITKYGSKGLDYLAEQRAKDEGNLHKDGYTNVHAGGTSYAKTETGNTLHERLDIAQTVTEGSTKSYHTDTGKGASAAWTATAEAGFQDKTTVDLGDGKSQTSTDAAYAGVKWENKAGYSVNAMGVTGEASTKVVGHAEYSHSESYNDGDTIKTETNTALVHGEAGAKVGGHLGLDGVSLQAKASAEIIAKVENKHETDYGNVKTHRTVEAFAGASAEARAEVDARVDLTKGEVKAKGSLGAEAAAGVGVNGSTGVHSANGNGADVGIGLYAGKIGAKFDGDIGFKDGKLSVDLEWGASLGLGATGKIQIKGDVKNAVNNVTKITENFSEKSFGQQVWTGVRLVSIETPINFIRGFWN